MKRAFARLRIGLVLAAVILAADQITKRLILDALGPGGDIEAPVRGVREIAAAPFLDFVLTWNRGVSFGVGNTSGSWNVLVFTLLSLLVSGYLVYLMAKSERHLPVLAQGLIVGGALGNVIDRLRFGAVVDFVYVHVGAFNWWPAFNVADSAICVGAVIWVFESLFAPSDSHMNRP